MRGRVKWFNNAKGYGFIACDGQPDVFVHYRSILEEGYKRLHAGEGVEFEITEGPKGRHAMNVRKMNE